MYYKNIFIFIFLLQIIFLFGIENSDDFYAVVSDINFIENNPITIHYENQNPKDVIIKDKIYSGSTILTGDNESIELILYKKNTPIGMILIGENTDFEIDNNYFMNLKVTYGRIRGVFDKGNVVTLNSLTVKSEFIESDFGFETVFDSNEKSGGYFIVFNGFMKISSLKNPEKSENLEKWWICRFVEGNLFPKELFIKNDLDIWKKMMLFKTKEIPDKINLVLENLNFDSKSVITKTIEQSVTKIDATPDLTIKNKQKKKINFDSSTSFGFGIFDYNISNENHINDFGAKIFFNPDFSFFNDKFEIGSNFNLTFSPGTIENTSLWGVFSKINPNSRFVNNEWSFGMDQNWNTGKMIFDIFDDVLIKNKIIRFNHPDDKIFIQYGEYYNISDPQVFLLYNFNPYYYPVFQRKESFITKFNFDWFESFIYAEDVMPKGLYGTNISFMTPAKSFKFKYMLSAFIDCYNLIQFDEKNNWYMPGQLNTNFIFDVFNLPSFGLSFFLNGGLYVPFSYKYNINTALIFYSGLIINFGFDIRVKDFKFSLEFVKDNFLNKIGMYDFSYSLNRDKKQEIIKDWYDDLENRKNSTDHLKDQYFGFRSRINYNFLKYVLIDISYQLGFASKWKTQSTWIGDATLPDSSNMYYYDKFSLKIDLDSLVKKDDSGLSFYLLWTLDDLINSIRETNFLQSNSLFLGVKLMPHKSIEFNIQGGMYYLNDQINFCFDSSIAIKPFYFER